jgi:hypothetical protein
MMICAVSFLWLHDYIFIVGIAVGCGGLPDFENKTQNTYIRILNNAYIILICA